MSAFTSRKSADLNGSVLIPGDKSISHRALIFGGIAKGETLIYNLLESDDVFATGAAMRALGAKIECGQDGIWRCHGTGTGNLQEPDNVIDLGNSGTSARLISGLVSSYSFTTFFTGDDSLRRRPMKRVAVPLQKMGAEFATREGGRLPMAVTGTAQSKTIEYKLPVPSAQVKSAVLLAGLNTTGTTTVIEDFPSRDHTERMLQHFGVALDIEELDDGTRVIKLDGPQMIEGCALDVPSDPSSAAFVIAAALICPNSNVTLRNICMNPGRIGLITTFREMGGYIEVINEHLQCGEPVADLVVRTSELRAVNVPASRAPSMIDEYPILSVVAAFARGTTKMNGLAELRVKESDRLAKIAEGLAACGVTIEEGDNWLSVEGSETAPKGGTEILTSLDHRIAMSFAVMGMMTQNPITLDDDSAIKTSFPNFIETMNGLGANMDVIGDS